MLLQLCYSTEGKQSSKYCGLPWKSCLYHDQKGRVFGHDRKSIADDRLDMQSTWHRSTPVSITKQYIHIVVQILYEILLVRVIIVHDDYIWIIFAQNRKNGLTD